MIMIQKIIKQNDFYRSSDLALATLLSLYYPIEAIDRTDPSGKSYFLFKRDEGLDQLVEQYWRRELRVEPQTYFNQLKLIKARLYNEM